VTLINSNPENGGRFLHRLILSVDPKTKREDFLVLRSAGSPEDEPIIVAIF
jgi:hypothetical protein